MTLHLTHRRPCRTITRWSTLAQRILGETILVRSRLSVPSTFLWIVPFCSAPRCRSNLDRRRVQQVQGTASFYRQCQEEQTSREEMQRGGLVSFASWLGQPLAIPGLFLCRVSNGHVSTFPWSLLVSASIFRWENAFPFFRWFLFIILHGIRVKVYHSDRAFDSICERFASSVNHTRPHCSQHCVLASQNYYSTGRNKHGRLGCEKQAEKVYQGITKA